LKKFTLFLVAGIVLAMVVPQSRSRVLEFVRPFRDANRERTATRTLKQIATDVQRAQARTGAYPQPAAFADWLRDTYDSADDPWGSAYYIEVYGDSFVVASAGPDVRARTSDDIRLVRKREPTAAGMGSAFQPPAPPPSSAKSTAVQKTQEAARREP